MSSETQSADEKVATPRDHSTEPTPSNRDSPILESQKDESQPAAPPPPPDGGFNAWLQAFGNFFLFFNSWGTINSYGVFQTYYATTMFPSESESAISWVGSIQTFLLLALGGVVGRWVDAGYFRTCITFGSFMMVFGMMMTSIAKEFWQVVLAQGIVAGLGSGFLFLPGVAVVSTYFSSRRAFALGLGAAGSSLGGVLFPIIIRNLIPKIGFGWAVRVMAFIMLGTLAVPCLVMRQRIPPRKMGPLIDLPSFKEPAYNFFTWGEAIAFTGLWTPFFYIGGDALRNGIDGNMSFYLLSIMNASSLFGRVFPNFVADKTGPLNILIPCAAATTILIFAWIRINTLAGLIVFAILYGFVSGAFVSLPPATIASLTTDFSKFGVRMGMAFAICGIGILIGPPISGALINGKGGEYWGAQVFAGTVVGVGGAVMAGARISKTGWKLMAKA